MVTLEQGRIVPIAAHMSSQRKPSLYKERESIGFAVGLQPTPNLPAANKSALVYFGHLAKTPEAELASLLKLTGTGYPLAMIRAQMIDSNHPMSQVSYDDLDKSFKPTHGSRWPDLIKTTAKTEADQYLATFLVAMERYIQQPTKPTPMPKPLFTTRPLQYGLADARLVTAQEMGQLYGKDTTLTNNQLYKLIKQSPKTALHEHQRGAVPISLVRAYYLGENDPLGTVTASQLQEQCRVDRLYDENGHGPLYEPGLDKYLKKYNVIAKSVHSTKTAYLAAYIYTLLSAMEQVRYFEYRFNPRSSKDPVGYARAIQKGIDDARQFVLKTRNQKIDANMIFSAYRGTSNLDFARTNPDASRQARVTEALNVLNDAILARKEGLRVTGFDVTGDELNFSIQDFQPVAQALHQYNKQSAVNMRIGATIHAGETPMSGKVSHPEAPLSDVASVAEAIKLFWSQETPLRIGHGLSIAKSPALVQLCKEKGIGVEQCPKSNVQTGSVPFYEKLPTLNLLQQDVKVSTSTDNRTLSKTSNTNELVKLTRYLQTRQAERQQLQMNGIDTAFIFDATQKAAIRQEMVSTYQKLAKQSVFQPILTLEKENLDSLLKYT